MLATRVTFRASMTEKGAKELCCVTVWEMYLGGCRCVSKNRADLFIGCNGCNIIM